MNNRSSEQDARKRRPLVAGLLSAVVPGVGQIYAGRTRRGAWLLGVSLLAVGLTAFFVLQDPLGASKLAFRPGVLISLLVADAVALAWRAFATVDAFLVAGGIWRFREWRWTAAAAAIAAILVLPHAAFAYYDLVQYDLITTLFAGSDATTTTMPTTTSTTSTTAPPGALTTSPPPTTTTTTTTTQPPAFWAGQERLNVLLLGSDSGVGRTGVRTDTIAVVSIEPDTGHAAVFSVPRNLRRVPVPQSWGIWDCDCYPDILNSLYGYAEARPETFPGSATPGANALKAVVGELLQIPVHYYALVNLDGFVDIVDAFGGVEITVTERIYDPAYPNEDGTTSVVDLQPGEYQFDGHEALIYARSRYTSDDYNRMGRQRCVVEALAAQADPFSLLRNFPTIADALERSLETDIPLDRVPELIDLVPLLNTDEIVSLQFIPPTYLGGLSAEGFPYPNTDLIREHVAVVMQLPPLEAMAALGVEPLSDACDGSAPAVTE